MASSPLLGVVVALGQPDQQPGQRQAGVAAQPEAAVGLDVPADAAQRAERAVEVVGAGQRPRLDDVEQVGLVVLGLPVDLAGGDGAGDGLDGELAGAVERRRGGAASGPARCAAGPTAAASATGRRARAARRRRAARASRGATAGSSRSRPDRVEGQPAVRLQQGAGRLGGGRALGEQAGVDGQQHRGVEVVGEHLDVGEEGHEQGGVGGRRALVERLAGGGDVVGGGVRVVLDQGPAGGQRRAARRPSAARCSRRRRRRRRRAGRGRRWRPRGRWRRAAATATAERSPEATRAGRRVTHLLHSRVDRPARAGSAGERGSFPRVGHLRPHPPALPSSDAREPPRRLRRGSPISGPRVPSPRRRSSAQLPPRREPGTPSRVFRPPWPPFDRVTPTPRWCRWRTPSRARCPPRWTGWPTATRS